MKRIAALIIVCAIGLTINARVKVAVWGDMYRCFENCQQAVDVLTTTITDWDFQLHVGDFTLSGTQANWEETLGYAPLRAMFVPGTFFLTTSNHEYGSDQSSVNWNNYTQGVLPTNTADGTTHFYHHVYDGANERVHVFSCDWYWTSPAVVESWLTSQLATVDPDDWIIAMWHGPCYDQITYKSPALNQCRGWLQRLNAAGADLVVHGHAHCYVRTHVLSVEGAPTVDCSVDLTSASRPDGMVHIVNGSILGHVIDAQPQTSRTAFTRNSTNWPTITFLEFDGNELLVETRDSRAGQSTMIVDQWRWLQGWHNSANVSAMPVIAPGPTSFLDSISISMTTTTPDATIYFTTDGNEPTQGSQQYTGPFTLTATTTVRARAFHQTLEPSYIARKTYSLRALATLQVIPGAAYVQPLGSRQFQATTLDQFGDSLAGVTVNWTSTCAAAVGTVNSSGLFTAGGTPGGPCHVIASSGGLLDSAEVSVGVEPETLHVTGISRPSYTLGTMAVGQPMYNDRAYAFSVVPPEYVGLDYILTGYASDATISDPDFLSFTVNRSVVVYVAVCNTNMTGGLPNAVWLRDPAWQQQSGAIVLDHYDANRTNYTVFARSYAPGVVTIPGNNGVQNMYSVIIAPDQATASWIGSAHGVSASPSVADVRLSAKRAAVHVVGSGHHAVGLWTLHGARVLEHAGTGTGSYEIRLDNVPAGIYVLRVHSNGRSVLQRRMSLLGR